MEKKIISITEGRKKLFKIAEEVQKPGIHYVLTIDGKPELVLMSADEFSSIMDTLDLLSEPGVMEDLKEAEKDFKEGNTVSLEEVEKEFGFTKDDYMKVAEEPKEKYKVRKRNKK